MPGSFGTSAQFSRELLDASLVQGMEFARPHLSQLITTVGMGDNEGNSAKYIVLGNESGPRELFGSPIEAPSRIGTYAFSIRPSEYGDRLILTDQELADANLPEWLAKAQAMGAKVPYWLENTVVANIMESSTAIDGFDGQPLYSDTHTWATSDQTPGDPAPTLTSAQDNIIAPARVSYTNSADVMTDFEDAVAQMNGFRDDKGSYIHSGDGQYFIVYNNRTSALDHWLQITFNPEARAGDDTARAGWRFRVTLLPTPHLTATGGSTDFDWYLFKLIPGQKPPLVVQERQGIKSETFRDPLTRINHYQYTIRYGFGWTNWWQTVKVDNA